MTDSTRPPEFDARVQQAREIVGETEFELVCVYTYNDGWEFRWDTGDDNSSVRVCKRKGTWVIMSCEDHTQYSPGGEVTAQIVRLQKARRIMALMNEHFGGAS